MRWNKKHKQIKTEWHEWFAWYPVYVFDSDQYVWWEMVERRAMIGERSRRFKYRNARKRINDREWL